jgi:hypothetical protein
MALLLCLIYPLPEIRGCFLADNDPMVQFRNHVYFKFHFFIRTITFNKIDADDILPVRPEKYLGVQVLLKLTKITVYQILLFELVNDIYNFVLGVEKSNIIYPQ